MNKTIDTFFLLQKKVNFLNIKKPLKKELIRISGINNLSQNLSDNSILNVKIEFLIFSIFCLYVVIKKIYSKGLTLTIPNFFNRKKILIKKEDEDKILKEDTESKAKRISENEKERVEQKINEYLDSMDLTDEERSLLKYLLYIFGFCFVITIFCFLSRLKIIEFLLQYDCFNHIFKKLKIQKNLRNLRRFLRKFIFKFKQFITFYIFKRFKHRTSKDFDV